MKTISKIKIMKYEIKQLNDTDAVVISDEEIKINDSITDGYRVWYWRDNCSLLGRKKVIATIAPFKIEGLPMLELPNQEEDVENFDELFLMNRNDLRVLFNAGNAGSGGALYNRVRKYNGFDEFRESNEGREFLIDKLYKAAQKQYSEDAIRKAFETGRNYQLTGENNFNELLQSLQKKQFPTSVELTEDFKPLKWYYE